MAKKLKDSPAFMVLSLRFERALKLVEENGPEAAPFDGVKFFSVDDEFNLKEDKSIGVGTILSRHFSFPKDYSLESCRAMLAHAGNVDTFKELELFFFALKNKKEPVSL